MNTFQWRQPSYCLLYIVVSWYFHRQWNFQSTVSSVLWRCWMGGRKGIRPVKNRVVGAGVVICLERGADLHMAQLMPLPLTVSCCSKIQIGFAFLVPAHPGSPGKRAVKCVCVCGIFIERTLYHWSCVFVRRHQRSMFGRWAFSVAGPTAWNSLPDCLRDLSGVPLTVFAKTWKLFSFYWRTQYTRSLDVLHYALIDTVQVVDVHVQSQ